MTIRVQCEENNHERATIHCDLCHSEDNCSRCSVDLDDNGEGKFTCHQCGHSGWFSNGWLQM